MTASVASGSLKNSASPRQRIWVFVRRAFALLGTYLASAALGVLLGGLLGPDPHLPFEELALALFAPFFHLVMPFWSSEGHAYCCSGGLLGSALPTIALLCALVFAFLWLKSGGTRRLAIYAALIAFGSWPISHMFRVINSV